MRLVRAFLVSAMLLSANAGLSHAEDVNMETLEAQIGTASTPAQHQAIADEYRKLAASARETANLHRKMGARYKQGKPVLDQSGHCSSIAARSDQDAKDYDALAAEHEAQAKK